MPDDLPYLVLAAASALNESIHQDVLARGFAGLRPAHGFVFVRLAPHGATVGEIAEHLGVTKQAASQIVEELVGKGYVERRPHPADARARLIVLTDRGWAVTRAADDAAAAAVEGWASRLGRDRVNAMREDLRQVVAPHTRIRPVW